LTKILVKRLASGIARNNRPCQPQKFRNLSVLIRSDISAHSTLVSHTGKLTSSYLTAFRCEANHTINTKGEYDGGSNIKDVMGPLEL